MIEGIVINVVDDKTVGVEIIEHSIHPIYKKVIRKKKKFICQVNGISLEKFDKVIIDSSRPYSKRKNHVVIKKL